MKKQVIDVIRSIHTPIEGNDYFFLQSENKTIGRGTFYKCEKCGKWCVVNAVTITAFDKYTRTVEVHLEMSDPMEMYYNEELDMSVCENC